MNKYRKNLLAGDKMLPAEIVLSPEWWHKNEGICFDKDFFFHPLKRVETEQRMEKILYERWGKYGPGQYRKEKRPELGAVHLASGFLLSEMMGCEIRYSEGHPPQVVTAGQELRRVDAAQIFQSVSFRQVSTLADALKRRFGYLTGDINWSGILNIALDLRGEELFSDMMTDPERVKTYFTDIAAVIERFTAFLQFHSNSTSISVNRNVRHLEKPVLLHSACSLTMIAAEDYEDFLLPFDQRWSMNRPFGVHYCGADPHRMATAFAKIPHLDFLDVGWGGDLKILRKLLPETFLNIRLSPVEMARQTTGEIQETITRLVHQSDNPFLTGVCCINMDDAVPDDRIDCLFETVENLRIAYAAKV